MATAVQTDYQSTIVTRAIKDRAFRAQLIANPEASIELALGIKLPSDVRIQVLEEAPNQIYLVLPSLSVPTNSDPTNLGLKEVSGFASANTHVGCGTCSVTAPPTSNACGCR